MRTHFPAKALAGAALVSLCACASVPQGRSAIDDVTVRGESALAEDDVTDRIASQRWTMDEISGLLLELSVAMRDEVAEIAAFDQMAVGAC